MHISIPVNGIKLRGWKHDILEKWVGSRTSYDVIALRPDLTRSTFLPQIAQRIPHKLHKISAQSAQRFGGYLKKNISGGEGASPPTRTGEG